MKGMVNVRDQQELRMGFLWQNGAFKRKAWVEEAKSRFGRAGKHCTTEIPAVQLPDANSAKNTCCSSMSSDVMTWWGHLSALAYIHTHHLHPFPQINDGDAPSWVLAKRQPGLFRYRKRRDIWFHPQEEWTLNVLFPLWHFLEWPRNADDLVLTGSSWIIHSSLKHRTACYAWDDHLPTMNQYSHANNHLLE